VLLAFLRTTIKLALFLATIDHRRAVVGRRLTLVTMMIDHSIVETMKVLNGSE
jgi:hypothetical protein